MHQPDRNIESIDSHMPVLDGIRGWAVLLVIACHATTYVTGGNFFGTLGSAVVKVMGFGWVGVDLFFVLSGFLITGILIKTRARPVYFRNFFAKRILRIFPLYYLSLMLFLFVLPYALQQDFYKEVGLPKSIFFAYMQNFFLSDKDNGILMQVVRPTWSLAVEEHFYLIWPAVIYYTRENKLQKILIALVISAILSRLAIVAGSNLSTIILRYWTTTWTVCRIDSLLIGALLAIALRCHAQRMLLERWRWALLIILVLLNALFMVLKYVSFLNYSLYALFFAAVINLVLFLPKKSWVVRIFDNGFFRSCGKYSYCMYLFHLPIMLLVVRNLAGISNYGLTGVFLLFTSSTLLVWLFAWSSWNLYEKHFLDLKRRFEQIDEKGEVDVDAASQELPICTSDGELR